MNFRNLKSSTKSVAVAAEGKVNDLSLSADGTKLATAGDDKILRLWEAATGKQLYEMAAGAIPRRDAVLTAALIMCAVMQPVVMHWNARVSVKPVELAGEVAAACMRIIGPDGSREVGGG